MLVGVLVDLSGSMENSLQLNTAPNEEEVTRVTSIFSTIMNIARREVTRNKIHEIFVLGFGVKRHNTVDLLNLLEKTNPDYTNSHSQLNDLLARHGAPRAEKYIRKYVSDVNAYFLYDFYSENIQMLQALVASLPRACKDGFGGSASRVFAGAVGLVHNNAQEFMEEAVTQAEVNKAIKIAEDLIGIHVSRDALINKVMQADTKSKTFESAIDLIERLAGRSSRFHEKEFSAVELRRLVQFIEPYIYGDTPMCEALVKANEVFRSTNAQEKIMFLLSDGDASDGDPTTLIPTLRAQNVTVFACLLTSENVTEPRRLFDKADANWTNEQLHMFELSSAVENTHEGMSVLLDLGWKIPESGESRLFLQANHPDVIDEFTSLIRSMADSNDALLNIVGRVTLDQYINSKLSKFVPNDQILGTCYANAVAAVMHLAMHRIEGREGIPEFLTLCEELMGKYGLNGENTERVLHEWLPKYRLQYKKVDESGARRAINCRRPVVATYRWYLEQKLAFEKFFQLNPKGIMGAADLGTQASLTKLGGHAVVLIKCSPDSLTFMNSWGTAFGDRGFFKVKDQSVLLNMVFYDVFWTLDDLLPNEKEAFNEKKRKVGEDLLRRLPERIRSLHYECPECLQSSPANQYKGHLQLATCPKCGKDFAPVSLGLQLSSYAK